MEIVERANAKSHVWRFFGHERTRTGVRKDEVVCRICENKLKFHGTTTTLLNHLASKHAAEYKELNVIRRRKVDSIGNSSVIPTVTFHSQSEPNIGMNGQSSSDRVLNSSKFLSDDPRQNDLTDRLLAVVIENCLPFSFVDSQSLREFCESMDPSFSIPNRKTVSKVLIPGQYEMVRNMVGEEMEKLLYVSITVDMRTSANNDDYYCVTAHGIDDSWCLIHRVLDVVFTDSDYSSINLVAKLQNIIDDWKIEISQIIVVTTNRAPNIRNAVLHWNKVNVPCVAEIIHSAVMSVLDDENLKQIFDKVKAISQMFHNYMPLSRELSHLMAEKGLEVRKCPFDCSPNTWVSMLKLLNFIHSYIDVIYEVFCKRHKYLLLSSEESSKIQAIVDILSPLAEGSEALIGESQVTSSSVKPFLFVLENEHLAVNVTDDDFTRSIKLKIITNIKEAYSQSPDSRDILLLCSILDPRFKELSFVDDETKASLKDLLTNKFEENLLMCSTSASSDIPKEPSSKFAKFLSKACPTRVSQDQSHSELRAYFREPSIPVDSDPMTWWSSHSSIYPTLANLARKYLCVSASSAPSERGFKAASISAARERNSLLTKNVRVMTFLSHNFKR